MPPPMKPCSARSEIICSIEVAEAQTMLIRVKPPAEMVNIQRVDSTRDSMPDSGIMITSAIR